MYFIVLLGAASPSKVDILEAERQNRADNTRIEAEAMADAQNP
jgi:hypothetical protein